MSKVITPVTYSENFDQWVAATNTLIQSFLSTVTVAANSSGDLTSGNGFITGIFGANTLVATTIRGGTVAAPSVLTISSDLTVTGSQSNVTSNVYILASNTVISTNSSVDAVTVTGNSSTTTVNINGTDMRVAANLALTGSLRLPVGNTGNRPTSANGTLRYNTDLGLAEIYAAGSWLQLAAFSNGIASASLVYFTPNANISSNNVQGAILETYAEKVSVSGDTMTGNLHINENGITLPTAKAGSLLQLGGSDGVQTTLTIDSFGNSSFIAGRRSDGINSAKTALVGNGVILSISAYGYDGNTYLSTSDVSIEMQAIESFTNTAHGTRVGVLATPIGGVIKGTYLTISAANVVVNTALFVTGVITGNGAGITGGNAAFLEGHNTAFFANASLLAGGTVGTGRLGSGTADATTFLRGDQAWAPVLQPSVTSTVTIGYTISPYNAGTISTGTLTPNASLGNYQYYTANGAHTIAAPTSDCAIDIMITNGSAPGTITFSGYTVSPSPGDPLTTTSTHKFIFSIRRINSISTYMIKALQ